MPIPTVGDALPRRGNRLTQRIAQAVLATFGWRIEGRLPNLSKFLIIAAPHTSNWDFPLAMVLLFAVGVKVHWMGKHTFFRWPIAGILYWLGGVPVDRRANTGAVDQMVAEFARRDRFVLGLAPEGTRRLVRKWKSGFYHMAVGAGVPITPLVMDYGAKVVRIEPPFQPTGDYEADLLQLQAFFAGARGRNPDQFRDEATEMT